MTTSSLPAVLRVGAQSLYMLESAAGLIIEHATSLDPDDFAELI